MAVISLKNKTKSGSLLVGNSYYIPPSFESIATVTVGVGGSSSISFSSIPSTYKHLQIRFISRSSDAAAVRGMNITFNGDTAANYTRHQLSGDGSTTSATGGADENDIQAGQVPGSTVASGIMGVGIYDIHDYASTTKFKTMRIFNGFDTNGSGTIRMQSGLWRSTSAISSLSLILNAGNFIEGTTFALYGIKG